jgi:poly(A) polymerase
MRIAGMFTSYPQVEAARLVAKRLASHGHRALLAGGAVRDLILGVDPHDADVATSAHPEEIARLFKGAKLVGAAFGVVLVPEREFWIEVATFRREGPYLDGRRPSSVEFTGEEEDARRRDFTVNGLFLDPATDEILDFVGGRADLEARILRAIGDPSERFREDHLRLLRAVRLAAQLDFTIEPATIAAIRIMAPLAANVAAERTRDELVRILTGPNPARGLELMRDTGLLDALLPEIAAMRGIEQSPQHHPEGDVLVHTILLFKYLEEPSPELAFAALLHDVGKPVTFERGPDRIRFPMHEKIGAEMAGEICRRLRFSNDSTERVMELVANHMRFQHAQEMRLSTLKRFLALPGFEEHLALHRADCLASHRNLAHYDFVRAKIEELGQEEIRPPRLISFAASRKCNWRD